MTAIEATNITKVFGSGDLAFTALRGVDLIVDEGELVMMCGPSGSGKTTLLSILGCVLAPTAGELSLFGQPIPARDRELARIRASSIGFVFQDSNLIPALTAEDNVAVPLQISGVPRKRALYEARTLLEAVGLADKLRSKPAELSGGQRQRVGVARALAGSPPLVLADEPTAALDAASGLAVTELLRDLCRDIDTTAVVVTHDDRIFHLADRIVSIEDGRIAGENTIGAQDTAQGAVA